MIVPLTGLQYQIDAGPYRATVTELGAGLRELSYHGQPVLAGYDPDELPPAGAGQLLAPWPNRIDGGRYAFGGTEHFLALTEPARGNAIHGRVIRSAWKSRPNTAWIPAPACTSPSPRATAAATRRPTAPARIPTWPSPRPVSTTGS